jgi:cytochrome c oxidase accessory protein FixG
MTLSIYFLLPWLKWHNKNLVLFDVHHRQFHIFWYTFWPQDFFLLVLLVLIAALALFFFTTLAGRLWCGYTCPQTVWTKIFLWIEYATEGDRNKRIRLDKSRLNAEKIFKRTMKHALWLLVAFLTAFTFGGYFQPIDILIAKAINFDLTHWDTFWICFFTSATYLNAGWMREQVCMYMCPYARIQSVMYDEETLVISYDKKRGENRGSRKKNSDYQAKNLGDCIDCHQCVHVCPTGIDIRDGLQMECIGCAACVDVCDAVMDKMGYPRGLVRYATERSLAKGKMNIIRPRLIIYGILLFGISTLFVYLLATRIPFQLDVIRDRAHLYQETSEGLIKNSYLLKLMNMSQKKEVYILSVTSPIDIKYKGSDNIEVKAGQIANIPVALTVSPEKVKRENTSIIFHIKSKSNPAYATERASRFIAPLEN